MAVYAPDDSPPLNMNPGMWARIRDFVFPPANAAESVQQGPNPAASPTPVPPALQSGGPFVPSGSGLTGGGLSGYTSLPPGVSSMAPSVDPITGLPTRVPTSGGPISPSMPYAAGQGTTGPAGSLGANPLLTPAQPNTIVGWGTPTIGGGPIWGVDPNLPDFNKLPASAGGGKGGGKGGGARIPSSARANVPPAASSNDRFIPIQYGTPGPSLAPQPGSHQPIYTALNLAGLFGGGANPANMPSAAAAPMSGGPLAKGSNLSKAPWNVGPLQKGMVFPSEMGPKKPAAGSARARILAPDYYG